MPKYKDKFTGQTIKAQQWNKPGDLAPWAFGRVREFDNALEGHVFTIAMPEGIIKGKSGDYISLLENDELYCHKKAYFEGKYMLADHDLAPRDDLQIYEDKSAPMRTFITARKSEKRAGYTHIPTSPLNSEPYHVFSLCIYRDQLFAATDKGVLVYDAKNEIMVHAGFTDIKLPFTVKETS